eukprot:TRINITY_DN4974_c0_g1_i1.p1 TRINITY_DN4974_c0_g1~~TRINITY_DN4974_c0_g1_i1.p1  ORF type:complete len:603 (-),score=169.55 TRINITY_DN4974_c0_g1_i1:604-2412(-)
MMSTLLSPKKVNVPQTAKEQELEIEELTKTNFNLKLRVFYLEEALRKGKSGDVQSSVDLKLQIDQYSKELEEKSKLLLKARGIIETLQSDLELARAAQDIKRTLEDDEAMKSGLDQQRRAERRIEDLELKLRQLHQADVSLRADNETQARQMQDITREAEEHRRQLEEQLQRVSSELAEVRHTWSTREQELLQDVTHSLNHRRQAEAELALRTAELSQLTESADKRSERERDLMAKLDARNALLTTLCKRLSDMFPDQAPTADVVSRFDVFADGITRVAAQLTKAKTSFEAVTVRNEQYCAAQIADLNERVSSKIRQLENAEGQLHALKAQTERQRQENLALRNAISSDVEKHALQRERARAEELELRLRNVQQQAEYSLRNERDSQTRLIQDVSREAIEHRKQLEADLQRTGSELAELKRSSSDRERDLTADVEARTVLLHSMAKRLGEAFPESAPTADLVYSKFEVFADAMMRVASMVGRVKSTFESHAARHELYCKEQLDNFNERLSQRVRQLESAESAQTRLHSQVEELRRDNMQLQRGSLTTNTEQMQIVRERDDAVQRVTELSSLVQNMRDRLLEMEDIGSRAGEVRNWKSVILRD